jgi:hypothetical protein
MGPGRLPTPALALLLCMQAPTSPGIPLSVNGRPPSAAAQLADAAQQLETLARHNQAQVYCPAALWARAPLLSGTLINKCLRCAGLAHKAAAPVG